MSVRSSSTASLFNFSNREVDSGFRGVKQRASIVAHRLYGHGKDFAVTFFTSYLGIHFCYIVFLCLLLTWIVYPEHNVAYIDALFVSASGVSLTGLATITLNTQKTYQQLAYAIIPMLGHPLVCSLGLVLYRLHLYRRKFRDIEQTSKDYSRARRSETLARYTMAQSRRRPHAEDEEDERDPDQVTKTNTAGINEKLTLIPSNVEAEQPNGYGKASQDGNKIKFDDLPVKPSGQGHINPSDMFKSLSIMRRQYDPDDLEVPGPALVIKSPKEVEDSGSVFDHDGGSGTRPGRKPLSRTNTLLREHARSESYQLSYAHSMTSNYLSWTPTVGHNSAFVGLSQAQKEELGGLEYRALRLLPYFILFHIFATIGLGFLFLIPWCYKRKYYYDQIESNGVSPVLFATTTVLFAFENAGLCVLPSSIALFWDTAYLPLVISFVSLVGGSCIPIMLRLYIWVVFKLSPRFGRTRETLGFLLDHPRRCYLYLLPSKGTRWLAFTLFCFHTVEIAFFMLLNRGSYNPVPYEHADRRFLAAWSQSANTRCTGLAIINVAVQHPAMQVLNAISMYLAIYPATMAVRISNVYEAQSLDEKNADNEDKHPRALGELFRRQFSMDAYSLVLSFFFLAITEVGPISRGEVTLFAIIYEIMSAHGTVGFSLGYGNVSTSGCFTKLGKLIVSILMIRSRHRSLPYRIDRAVILNAEELTRRDEEQERITRHAQLWLPRSETSASRLSIARSRASTARRRDREAATEVSSEPSKLIMDRSHVV